jgi:hypothetical protein
VVFNGEDFGYSKNRTRNYLLSQGRAIWDIIQTRYMISATLENATQGELQGFENNYKALNLITTALGRNVYDRVSHLKTTHNVWLKLCNIYEGSSEIKSSCKDTYNRQYQTFSQKPREYLRRTEGGNWRGVNQSRIKFFCMNWPMSQVQTSKQKNPDKGDEHTNQQCRNDPLEVTNAAEKWDQLNTRLVKYGQNSEQTLA